MNSIMPFDANERAGFLCRHENDLIHARCAVAHASKCGRVPCVARASIAREWCVDHRTRVTQKLREHRRVTDRHLRAHTRTPSSW
jgi:hypothetical protein